MQYTITQLCYFLLIYSFLGWCAETAFYSVFRRRLVNVGFLTMPLILTYGISMVILAVALPSCGSNIPRQLVITLLVSAVVEKLIQFNLHRIAPDIHWNRRSSLFGGTVKGLTASLLIAGGYFLVYQMLHPMLIFLFPLIPVAVRKIVVNILMVLVVLDLLLMIFAARRGIYLQVTENDREMQMADRLSNALWRRIQKTYPDIRDMTLEEERAAYTFAKGLNLYKMIWVFLISSLLGDCIEMLYCRLVGGHWMSRSGVLYGPFSFVWGIGAVVLTVVLTPLAKKNDRWVFLGGFLVGGAYEYLCSVFTEVVFGKVFWDYSYMPLNIGGRTNVLFMFFWGVLSVVWVKMLYPPMSGWIEKIPPLTGQILTWVLVTAMSLNAGLSMMAMLRYNVRQTDPVPYSQYDEFLDNQYPDELIEKRWENMISVEVLQE